MSAQGVMQLVVLLVLLAATVPFLGRYMAKVYTNRDVPDGGGPGAAPGDRVFLPIERLLYRLLRVDPRKEQRWNVYAISLVAFSVVSLLITYAVLRFQGSLPVNPTDRPGVAPYGAFNVAVSFVTNTNWQWYSGEAVMSHLAQMVALTVQNFASAAAGMVIAVAIIRGIARRRGRTLGNFWVDLVRSTTRILMPIAILAAVVLMGLGVVQNFRGDTTATTVDKTATAQVTGTDGKTTTEKVTTQEIPGGPAASQVAIKQLGSNGGGFFNANSIHPFENPNGWSNLIELYLILLIPLAFPVMFGRMIGSAKQGLVLLAVMCTIWLAFTAFASFAETGGNPALTALGVDQGQSAQMVGGNLEGKDLRFGPSSCAQWAAATTGTSNGSVNCQHDSMTPMGGGVAMLQMKLGEVSPGGVGVGLMGILINALLAVFIAGLMVGRTPEYLGKKIQASEMKLVVLYIVAMPLGMLVFAAISVVLPSALSSLANPGAHGLSEVLYNYASAANNNGSAFGGHERRHRLVHAHPELLDADRALHVDHPGAGHRRLTGPQEQGARDGGNISHRLAALRRAPPRRDPHRGRTHVLPGDRPRPDRRTALAGGPVMADTTSNPNPAGPTTHNAEPGGDPIDPETAQTGADMPTLIESETPPTDVPDGTPAEEHGTKKRNLFDRAIVGPAIGDSFRKLNPRAMARNPVMFIVEAGALLTTVLCIADWSKGSSQENVFALLVALWLWATVLFANFAEAMAEGRGKAQAATLRKTRAETMARVRLADGTIEERALDPARPSATCAWSSPARSSPATATSSRGSPRSTNRPSPASRLRSSESPAATGRR